MELGQISPALLAGVLLAIAVGGLFKGMTGLGLPLFAVPALALITSVEEAVVMMIFPSIAANLWLVVNHRQHRALLRQHLPFLLTGFVGALLGTWLLQAVSDRGLKLMLVVWLGLYLVQYFVNRDALSVFGSGRGMGYPLGTAAGVIQGATGISAQVVAPYYHAHGLVLQPYAFTVAFTFLFLSLGQFAGMSGLALLNPQRIQLSLMAMIPALVFTRIGIGLAGQISTAVFNRILLVTFVAMEIKLLVDVF